MHKYMSDVYTASILVVITANISRKHFFYSYVFYPHL